MPSRLPPLSRPFARCCALAFALAATALGFAGSVQVNVKDNKGASVADAVVSLVPLDTKPALTVPAEPLVIAQIGQEFEPRVTPLLVGTRVSFPNRDAIRHQVFSVSKTKRFEIPLYGPGAGETLSFDKAGIVALGCNIHDWMAAYVVVLETPFFVKTPADGVATLPSLPPGRYRLDVWHPRLINDVAREITVAGAEAALQTIAITLKPDSRRRRAPDGLGAGYK
ncbi:MAG: hypothetical protein NTV51_23925 [Verrucomicrobia bacterium]|nr:hypothetical protein [Verrucomicrobiota bacterium]